MQALTQLCNRAIWLDKGEIVLDGLSSEVVARYLQSGYGTGSVREWPDVESAPGDDLVRLRRIRVVQDDEDADAVDVRRPVGLELAFTVLRTGRPVFPKIKLFDAQGNVAFNAIDTSRRWDDPARTGDYVSTAWIPGNFLNEGVATVVVQICSLAAPELYPHLTSDPIAFHVQDPGDGDSARGRFVGQWKGVVRPLLQWTTEEG
ncbi:MAG TPA: hypothetical protein VMN35_04360, partial [Gaiellaceae bacterium]|nr:hypothetical protein [Gaiellaceae bacterium]